MALSMPMFTSISSDWRVLAISFAFSTYTIELSLFTKRYSSAIWDSISHLAKSVFACRTSLWRLSIFSFNWAHAPVERVKNSIITRYLVVINIMREWSSLIVLYGIKSLFKRNKRTVLRGAVL